MNYLTVKMHNTLNDHLIINHFNNARDAIEAYIEYSSLEKGNEHIVFEYIWAA